MIPSGSAPSEVLVRLVTQRLVLREFEQDDWRAVLAYSCAVNRALPMRHEAALREEHSMPTYVMLMKWTEQGAKDAKNALNRQEQGRAALEQAGGRMIGSWWTQGAYDAVVVLELPDDETASAAALALGMQGNVRTETMRAYGRDEMQRLLQKLP